ncbi:MAG TPA: G1 family glutamic endopeptidase [Acidimicrobiales bacterium]
MRVRASKLIVVAVGLAGLVVASGGMTKVSASGRPTSALTGVMIRAKSHSLLPMRADTVNSLNWSGYAVTPSAPVTGVSSTFTVPAAGLVPPGFAATWAGIGGFVPGSTDLIQAGISEQSLPDNPVLGPQYFAWYELLPDGETQLTNCAGDPNCTVTPGDQVSVDITQASGSNWNISVVDSGKWNFSKTVPYSSSRSSAEWILEAPTLVVLQTLLAPVGTVHFGPTNSFTAGTTQTIAEGNPTTVILSPGLINEATPSPLAADGQSFNDCAYAQTCPTP